MNTAEEWEAIHSRRPWGKFPITEAMEFGIVLQQYNPGSNVLDLGCGNGAMMWWFLARGRQCDGIDISPSAVKKTKEHLKIVGFPTANVMLADMNNIPVKNDSYGAVTDVCAMQHNKDIEGILKEVRRILKPKGIFFSVFRAGEGDLEEGLPFIMTLKRDEFARKLQNYFHIITLEYSVRSLNNASFKRIHHLATVGKV